MDTEAYDFLVAYDSRLTEIVKDYSTYLNRERLWKMCLEMSEEFDVEPEEVLEDVDMLYVEEFGDLYE